MIQKLGSWRLEEERRWALAAGRRAPLALAAEQRAPYCIAPAVFENLGTTTLGHGLGRAWAMIFLTSSLLETNSKFVALSRTQVHDG